MAAAILIFNLLDGIFTLGIIYSGNGVEANPLMAQSLEWGSVPFMAIKLGLVSLGVTLLYRLRERRIAMVGMATAGAVYAAVLLIYHVQSVTLLASSL